MKKLSIWTVVVAAGLVPGFRLTHAQPPLPGELNELIVLLRAGDGHPSAQEVVETAQAGDPLPGGLAEGNPYAAKLAVTRRARGPLRDWLLANGDHPRARMERYVVLAYRSPVNVTAIANGLSHNPHVEHVEVNRLLTLSSARAPFPSDPLLDSSSGDPRRFQWAPGVLRLLEAAARVPGMGTAGIIDRGLNPRHPDLRGFHREPDGTLAYDSGNLRTHQSIDANNDDCDIDERDPNDDVLLSVAGHGDHVAGLLAATTDNGIGGIGACPGCALVVAKAFRANSNQTAMDNAAEALTHLVDEGIRVVNMSFGVAQEPCSAGSLDLSALCQAIELAARRDVVLVASSGNNRSNRVNFPANSDQVIAVGGVSYDPGTPEGYSFWDDCPTGVFENCNCPFGNEQECGTNFGPRQTLVAPATDIVSTMYEGFDHNDTIDCGDSYLPEYPGFGPCSGTSMSGPQVAGIAGLDVSANPILTRDEIRDVLVTTASQAAARDDRMGHGVPDADASVSRALGSVGGRTLVNRLTPAFLLESPGDKTHVVTTSPTFASALLFDIEAPFVSVGPGVAGYNSFPDAQCVISPCDRVPGASFYVFTTDQAPFPGAPPLVPLWRMRYDPNLPFRCDIPKPAHIPNRDYAYTTSEAGILHFADVLRDANGIGYELEAVEGFIIGRCEPEPECIPDGAERIFRLYHRERDDYAIFPESELAQWLAAGYEPPGGLLTDWLGYSFPNVDSDFDRLIDGFELMIGTDPFQADTDCDGLSDGEEVLDYDMTSSVPSQHGYGDALLGPCTTIFTDGFETGDTSRWTGSSG